MPAVEASFRGEPAIVLSSASVEATFLPRLGMLGASLRFGGEQHLSLHGGLDAFRALHTTGMPLLHPWANRLSAFAFDSGGAHVEVPRDRVHLDPNGLPIHGLLLGQQAWTVDAVDDGAASGSLTASFEFGGSLLDAFPFEHRLVVIAAVLDDRLRVSTTVHATGSRAVPISFGWHPYFVLPGVERDELGVELPKCHHLELDERGIPTGREHKQKRAVVSLAGTTFDDAYRLGRDRRLGLVGGGRALRVELDDGYPCAQVYAPEDRAFVALEPMTAPTDALVTGKHPSVAPGKGFTATFEVVAGS